MTKANHSPEGSNELSRFLSDIEAKAAGRQEGRKIVRRRTKPRGAHFLLSKCDFQEHPKSGKDGSASKCQAGRRKKKKSEKRQEPQKPRGFLDLYFY